MKSKFAFRRKIFTMKKFNDWLDKLAQKITNSVGSMWCAIIFTIIALTSLPSEIRSSIQTVSIAPFVQWTAQTFLQLVLLSIILKGQNIEAKKQEHLIERINYNTAKTEAATERIEHLVQIIEKDVKKEIEEVAKAK
jgi:hypothetical protein